MPDKTKAEKFNGNFTLNGDAKPSRKITPLNGKQEKKGGTNIPINSGDKKYPKEKDERIN